MLFRSIIAILICIVLISCKEEVAEENESFLIEREKIDTAFGYGISGVLFDHLYIVVDSLTYAGLTQNRIWQNGYATLDTGLPHFESLLENTTTCYLRGHKHYIEILGPNNVYNEPVGKSGLGFMLNNKGEHFHPKVKPKMKTSKDSFLYASETVQMPVGDSKETWFKAFYTPSPGTALHTWYGFYNPAFLNSLGSQEYNSYVREDYLEKTYNNDKLFQGINAIELNCTLNDYLRIGQELGNLKCKLLEKDGTTMTIAGGDIAITISLSDDIEYSRITKIYCQLNQTDDSVTHLGNLIIENQGVESIWNLNKLHNTNTQTLQ